MPTTVRVRRPSELLAYVPYRLGYPPRESIVVVSLRAPRTQVGLVVRMDLDDLTDSRGGRALARTVARHLERDGAVALVLVAYTDRPDDSLRPALDVLDDELGAAAPVADRWRVTSRGYANIDCHDAGCCPPDGRPLTDLTASEVAAELVYAGAAIAASREHAYQLPGATAEARQSARRAANRWRKRQGSLEPSRWRADGLAAWRRALDDGAPTKRAGARSERGTGPTRGSGPASGFRPPPEVGSAAAGRLAAALADRQVRDAVLVSLTGAPAALVSRLARASGPGDEELDAAVGDALAVIVDPASGREPDESRTIPARRVLERVAALARDDEAAAALTLLALLAWWHGDGGLACARLEAAFEADPSHRLARILRPAIEGGMAPGWVRARRGASGSV